MTSFQANQETRQQRADPLNATPVEFNTPNGWRGSFTIARGNAVLDSLIASVENEFWTSGRIGSGTIYQYIREPDGTTTTWEYNSVSMTLNTDRWQASGMVHQTVSFFASTRKKIS